jgi:hypothetical protein
VLSTKRLIGSLFAALLLIAAAARASSGADLVVAQLRADGIVVPFARFDGDQWSGVSAEDLSHMTDGSDGRVDTLRGGDWFDTVSDPEVDAQFRLPRT